MELGNGFTTWPHSAVCAPSRRSIMTSNDGNSPFLVTCTPSRGRVVKTTLCWWHFQHLIPPEVKRPPLMRDVASLRNAGMRRDEAWHEWMAAVGVRLSGAGQKHLAGTRLMLLISLQDVIYPRGLTQTYRCHLARAADCRRRRHARQGWEMTPAGTTGSYGKPHVYQFR